MKMTVNLAAWIGQVIEDFIEQSPQNTLQNKTNLKSLFPLRRKIEYCETWRNGPGNF